MINTALMSAILVFPAVLAALPHPCSFTEFDTIINNPTALVSSLSECFDVADSSSTRFADCIEALPLQDQSACVQCLQTSLGTESRFAATIVNPNRFGNHESLFLESVLVGCADYGTAGEALPKLVELLVAPTSVSAEAGAVCKAEYFTPIMYAQMFATDIASHVAEFARTLTPESNEKFQYYVGISDVCSECLSSVARRLHTKCYQGNSALCSTNIGFREDTADCRQCLRAEIETPLSACHPNRFPVVAPVCEESVSDAFLTAMQQRISGYSSGYWFVPTEDVAPMCNVCHDHAKTNLLIKCDIECTSESLSSGCKECLLENLEAVITGCRSDKFASCQRICFCVYKTLTENITEFKEYLSGLYTP